MLHCPALCAYASAVPCHTEPSRPRAHSVSHTSTLLKPALCFEQLSFTLTGAKLELQQLTCSAWSLTLPSFTIVFRSTGQVYSDCVVSDNACQRAFKLLSTICKDCPLKSRRRLQRPSTSRRRSGSGRATRCYCTARVLQIA